MVNQTLTHILQPSHAVQTAIDFAEKTARQSGARLTPIRRHIYTCLLQSNHPLGAYDILGMLDGIGSQKTSDSLPNIGLVDANGAR